MGLELYMSEHTSLRVELEKCAPDGAGSPLRSRPEQMDLTHNTHNTDQIWNIAEQLPSQSFEKIGIKNNVIIAKLKRCTDLCSLLVIMMVYDQSQASSDYKNKK